MIVDSFEGVDALTQHVKTQTFVVCQHYNHTFRSYQEVLCLQAVQVENKLYVIDCLSVGAQQTLFEDRKLLKITAKATKTGQFFNKVIETNCPVLTESLSNPNIDFRVRPIPESLLKTVQTDIQQIGSLFKSLPQFSIRDKPIELVTCFDTQTLKGRLMKLRDEIA